MNYILFTTLVLLGFGCNRNNGKELKNEIIESDTIAIYLPPISYDSIVKSIKTRLVYENDQQNGYIPTDKEITMIIEYNGRMKDIMKHGTMNIIARDSSVLIKKISDTTFKFRVYKPSEYGIVSMELNPSLKSPYFFTYTRENNIYRVQPGENIPAYLRSYLVE